MHNSPPPPPLPITELDSISIQMFNDYDDQHNLPATSSSLWDWTDFLDFDQFTAPPFPTNPPPPTIAHPAPEQSPESTISDKVRKRDPRLVCSNYLAGRIPCACPELDAKLAEMEEEEEIGPGKKKARTVRVGPSGFRCQVPGCGVDISELKGYHKRHKVCLGCANAISVFIDGESKRYCQQCGKFHILSDFDEGKRSCRRKLERHNNRRRRKSTDIKGLTERDTQQLLSAEDVGCDDVTVGVSLNNQEAEREALLDVERPVSLLSTPSSQNIQSDSGVSLAGSGETQCDEEKEKCNQSPSDYDNKNVFSSVCPTGRISFKLYDWNPAEFPRRLRHQIFQWLASMPVELEGYVRPGCTILTVFIAMPNSMWVKLCGDPVASIQRLVAPGSMLFGKGSFYVYLNNVIFRVLKDGTSVVKVQVKKEVPKLHYVHPTCFEAGKPMELLVCGSNLLQPKFRFLVSFSGDYLSYDGVSFSSLNNNNEDDDTSSTPDHQLLKICVPHTETNLFGPAFVEVENESGVSNFIPILIGDQSVCSEMNILQHKLVTSLRLKGSQFEAASSSSSCDVAVSRQKYFSEFILDVAWLLKGSALEDKLHILTPSQIQRFNGLLKFLVENQCFIILERVAYYVKIIVNNSLISGVNDADMKQFKKNIEHANARLSHKFQGKVNYAVPVINYVSQGDYLEASSKIDMFPYVSVTNQDILTEENKFRSLLASTSLDRGETAPLLNAEVIMSVNNLKAQQRMPSSLLSTKTVLPSRPLIFLVSAVAVCFGICAIVLHRQKVGEIAVTIRRCLFEHS